MQNMDEAIILIAGDFIPPHINHKNIYSEELRNKLQNKDFSIVNLETPFTNSIKPIKKSGDNFKVIPDAIQYVNNGYFDAVTLANNHIRDYGDEGVLDTMKICKESKILTVGAGKNIDEAAIPLRIYLKEKKIAILNYCEREFSIASADQAGANPYDTINAYYDIKKEKERNDIVIIIFHGGLEYNNVPLPGLKKNLEFMIENGADTIICHHTHYISGFSQYKGKPIFYGLGNFYIKYRSQQKLDDSELHIGQLVKLIFNKNNELNYELILMKKSEDQMRLDIIKDLKAKEYFSLKINSINKIINSEKLLNSYWEIKKNDYKKIYYTQIKYSSNYLKKIFRIFNLNNGYRNKWIRKIVNLIRCDSHREMIIRSFKD